MVSISVSWSKMNSCCMVIVGNALNECNVRNPIIGSAKLKQDIWPVTYFSAKCLSF